MVQSQFFGCVWCVLLYQHASSFCVSDLTKNCSRLWACNDHSVPVWRDEALVLFCRFSAMLWKPAQSQDTSTHSHDIRLYAGDIVRGEMASFVMNEKQTGAGRMRATLELQPIWEEPSVVHIPCDP